MVDPIRLGRYSLFAKLASGGMAAVYLARLDSDAGFGRTVAIKRLHPHLARQTEFAPMFLDEARLAARVSHPNVVPMLDVVQNDGELFLVMEYIRGASLASLLRTTVARGATIPVPIVVSCVLGVLNGLHAAHEARDELGRPLSIVHRDVSPQNVMVGVDGVARVLDFGIAKAAVRLQTTLDGAVKGKLAYMAPEQIGGSVSRSTDIYACGVVLWEALSGRRLHSGSTEMDTLSSILHGEVLGPSTHNREVPVRLDRITERALAKEPAARYSTALEMAQDLDRAVRPASAMAVAEWVLRIAGDDLAQRDMLVAEIESGLSTSPKGRPELPAFEDGGSAPKQPIAVSARSHPAFDPSLPTTLSRGTPAPMTREDEIAVEPRVTAVRTRGRMWGLFLVGLAMLLGLGATGIVLRERTSTTIPPARGDSNGVVVDPHRSWFTACNGKQVGDPCERDSPRGHYVGKCWSIKSQGGILGCNRVNEP